MKKYIKSSTKINTVDAFEKLVTLAHRQVICAVSACIYDFDVFPDSIRKDIVAQYKTIDEYNKYATDSLDKELALSQYKYFETFGGWVEPNTGETIRESSFVVLGPEYDVNYFGADNSVESFRQWAIGLCKKYHQWAVLVIDGGSVHGTYYDGEGKVVKEYNNITSRQIGNFFTQLARHQGADSFTLTADTHLRVPYIVTSLRDKYRNHTLKDIYAQRETDFYKWYVNDLWDKL